MNQFPVEKPVVSSKVEVSHDTPSHEERELPYAIEALRERFDDLTERFVLNEDFSLELRGVPSPSVLDAHLFEVFKKEINNTIGVTLNLDYSAESGQLGVKQIGAEFKSPHKDVPPSFVHITPHETRDDLYSVTYVDPSANPSSAESIKRHIFDQEVISSTLDSLGLVVPNGVTWSEHAYEQWTNRLINSVRTGSAQRVNINEKRTDFHRELPPAEGYWNASNDIGYALISAARSRSFESKNPNVSNEIRDIDYTIGQLHRDSNDADQPLAEAEATEQHDVLQTFSTNGKQRFFAYSQTNLKSRGNEIIENPPIDMHEFTPAVVERFHRILLTARNERKKNSNLH